MAGFAEFEPDTAQAQPARWPWLVAAALLAAHAVLAWQTRTAGVTHSNDDALYALLGRGLEHFSYRETFRVGAPLHGQYPPGWPLLIALANIAGGHREAVVFGLVTLLSTVALALFFDVARRLLPIGLALGVLAAAALNPNLVGYAGRVMSESAYWFWTSLTLWALIRAKDNRRLLLLGGLAALAAAFTRSIGVTLVGAVLVAWLVERRWRDTAILAALALVLFGAWMAYTWHAHEAVVGRSYMADAGQYLQRVTHGDASQASMGQIFVMRLREQLVGAIPAMLPLPRFGGTVADNLLWLSVSLGLGVVGALAFRRRLPALSLYLVFYYGLLAVWPWAPRRFFIPIQPLVVLIFTMGALAVAGVNRPRLGRGMAAALLAAILVVAIPASLGGAHRMAGCDRDAPWTSAPCYSPDQQSFFAAVTYARDSLPADATYLVEREAAFAYHTGRTVEHAQVPLRYTDEEFQRYLGDAGIDYALLTRLTQAELNQLAPKLLKNCSRLALERVFPPHARMYRVLPEPARGTSNACLDLADYLVTTPKLEWLR